MSIVVFSAFHLSTPKWIPVTETPASCDQTIKQDGESATQNPIVVTSNDCK